MIPVFAAAALTVVGNLNGMLDAYLTAIAEKHWTERKAKVEAMHTPDQVRARQIYIRDKILESLGLWPAKTPLNARLTGTIERDGYRIDKLIYESLPGFKVTANLYVPTRGKGPFPAILGTAGHTDEGKAGPLYQLAWIGMVKRGWIVLAYDPPGQGERSEYWDASAGKSSVGIGTREHSMTGLQCTLTGTSIARYEIWDGIRGVDYLVSRSDVDPLRLAVAGNSGGGTQTAYLMALEPRLSVAAPSCYITNWDKLWFKPGPQDAEQDFHAFISNGLNFADFLIAFGPKPFKMMTAIRDFFPIEGARATFKEASDVYELLDARSKAGFFEFDDTHGWSKPRREATYQWFEKWLNGKESDGAEAEAKAEKASDLNATTTGQLATSEGGETVASLNRKLALDLFMNRRGTSNVSARLNFAMPAAKWTARKLGEEKRDSYRVEKIALETEPGITVPGLLYKASNTSPRAEAAVWLNQAGKDADEAEVASGVTTQMAVFAIDPRGWGESAPPMAYQTWMRAYLLGRTIVGMQAVDVIRAAEYLKSRGFGAVTVYGKGVAGPLAIYSGILGREAIAKVRTDGQAPSYMELVRMREHNGFLDMIVPGVLQDFDLPDLKKLLGDRYAE